MLDIEIDMINTQVRAIKSKRVLVENVAMRRVFSTMLSSL